MIRNDKLPAKLSVHSATWQLWGDVWCLVGVKFRKGLNLLGPDWKPLWRNTTSVDVAGFLADAKLILDIEKAPPPEQKQLKLVLASRRAELVSRFIYHFPGHTRLEVLAADIDRERLFYECALRKIGAPDIEPERQRRRRIREAATILERELPNSDLDGAEKILEELPRLRNTRPKRFEVPWHRFARRICLEYMVALLPVELRDWPKARYSRAHDAPQVRFVQQALDHIGVRTITRSAIYKVAYVPDGTETPRPTRHRKPDEQRDPEGPAMGDVSRDLFSP